MVKKGLFYLRGLYLQNHVAEVYSENKEDITRLNLKTSDQISKVDKAEIYIDYGGSIIDAEPLEVKLAESYSLFIRKESFNSFVNALTRKGFFEEEGNLYAFHCRNLITTFTYVPKEVIEKISAYDFSQHSEEISEHLDRFHQAMADVSDYYAKQEQNNILNKLKEDLKDPKGNKNLN